MTFSVQRIVTKANKNETLLPTYKTKTYLITHSSKKDTLSKKNNVLPFKAFFPFPDKRHFARNGTLHLKHAIMPLPLNPLVFTQL